jgi:hypothetical protein
MDNAVLLSLRSGFMVFAIVAFQGIGGILVVGFCHRRFLGHRQDIGLF